MNLSPKDDFRLFFFLNNCVQFENANHLKNQNRNEEEGGKEDLKKKKKKKNVAGGKM